MNHHDKTRAPVQQSEYARELAGLLSLLETAGRQITPEHVAQRFCELLALDRNRGAPDLSAAAMQEALAAAQALADLASAYLALGNNRETLDLAQAATQEALAAAIDLQTAVKEDVAAIRAAAGHQAADLREAPKSERGEILLTTQRLAARLADALYRVGDAARAEQVVNQALEHAIEPDLLVDLHWTLAQCRMRAGKFEESLATLDQALASPGISARHRARLLVLAARTHNSRGDFNTAGQVAETALEEASQAGDNWAVGWALHVLTIVTGAQGQMTDALPLFERALIVTEADPALTDLRVLLQINMAVTLGNLDRYEEAVGAAREALCLADQADTVIRRVQAHTALAELLFDTGRWAEAMAEVEALPEDVKEPMAACCDLGIAAVICCHRGDIAAARSHLAAAAPHAEKIGAQVIGSLLLARSLDREYGGDPADALAVLTAGFAENSEELDEIEDLLPDATRLATETGNLGAAQALAGQAAALAARSEIPHRQANALYCDGLVDHDAVWLLAAAERYGDAGRPLLVAAALEAAAREFADTGDRSEARAAFTHAVEIYTSLGAAADVARLQARVRAHGIPHGQHAKHRQASSNWDRLVPADAEIAVIVAVGLSNPRIATKLLLA